MREMVMVGRLLALIVGVVVGASIAAQTSLERLGGGDERKGSEVVKSRLDLARGVKAVHGEHMRAWVWSPLMAVGEVRRGYRLWTPRREQHMTVEQDRDGVEITVRPAGTCDSKKECEGTLESMCSNAGFCGVNSSTVQIIIHADMVHKSCSGDCVCGCKAGVCPVAWVECGPLTVDPF